MMNEEQRRKYFYTGLGYLGGILILISQLRYLLVADDAIGSLLALFALLCLGGFMNYAETKIDYTPKEKRIIKGSFLVALIIVFLVGTILIFK